MEVKCPYCQSPTILVTAQQLYGLSADPLKPKNYWACLPCKAWVGCHGNSEKPLGTPAKANLRRMRRKAHAVFDPLWMAEDGYHRDDAYAWLGKMLGITGEVHIGEMNVRECERVIEICEPLSKKLVKPMPVEDI